MDDGTLVVADPGTMAPGVRRPRGRDDGEEVAGRIRWSEREHACTTANRRIFDAALR